MYIDIYIDYIYVTAETNQTIVAILVFIDFRQLFYFQLKLHIS